jgi:hypothetical protein
VSFVLTTVLTTPPASPAQAIAHFAARLSFETDVSDVRADLVAGVPGLVVVDRRGAQAWARVTCRAPSTCPPLRSPSGLRSWSRPVPPS